MADDADKEVKKCIGCGGPLTEVYASGLPVYFMCSNCDVPKITMPNLNRHSSRRDFICDMILVKLRHGHIDEMVGYALGTCRGVAGLIGIADELEEKGEAPWKTQMEEGE